MDKVPLKVVQRLTKQIPVFKKVLQQAEDRDVNEADTVTIVVDMLSNIFGFDRYSEITKEFQISKTFCDLAIKVNNKVEYLVEVKAIGSELGKEAHIRQAVNYGAKEGINWVVLTNGVEWIVYRILLKEKVTYELVCSINIKSINPRVKADQQALFMLCRRGVDKNLIKKFYEYRQQVNKFTVAAVLMSDDAQALVARALRKLTPGLKVDKEEIAAMIRDQVIKRELVESDAGKAALSKLRRTAKKKAATTKPKVTPVEN